MDYSGSAVSWFERLMDFLVDAANGEKAHYYADICSDKIYPELKALRVVALGKCFGELSPADGEKCGLKLSFGSEHVESHFFIGDATADEAHLMHRIRRAAAEKYPNEDVEIVMPKRKNILGWIIDLFEGNK
mgnify:FL=1